MSDTDKQKRFSYEKAVTNSPAALQISQRFETVVTTRERAASESPIHLQALEVLIANEEAADMAVLQGRLQQSLT